MFALGESGETISAIMESLLSSPPDEVPSVEEMFENLQQFLGPMGLTRLEAKDILLTLISKALRLKNVELNNDVRLVDFLKYVRRKNKANASTSEPVSGLESWFSDQKFQQALSQASNDYMLAENLRNFSDSRRTMYLGTFVDIDVSKFRKAEVTLSGIKYPTPNFDLNIKFYNFGQLEADIFLSELLLRPPWRIVELDSIKLDICLKELVYLSSMLLASFRPS